jgi:hypothetical protein
VKLRLVLVAVLLAFVGTACDGGLAGNRHQATADTVNAGAADNPYVPADKNLGQCVSSNPQPDCGSKAQGGWHQWLTFAVLMVGMAFIGWRVLRAARRRDRAIAAAAGPERADVVGHGASDPTPADTSPADTTPPAARQD